MQNPKGVDRVICYESRTVSSVERKYSQIEKEALVLVWACEQFYVYLYGADFELLTDHKSLEFLFLTKSKVSARF